MHVLQVRQLYIMLNVEVKRVNVYVDSWGVKRHMSLAFRRWKTPIHNFRDGRLHGLMDIMTEAWAPVQEMENEEKEDGEGEQVASSAAAQAPHCPANPVRPQDGHAPAQPPSTPTVPTPTPSAQALMDRRAAIQPLA